MPGQEAVVRVLHQGETHDIDWTHETMLELLRPLLGEGAQARVVTALRIDGVAVPDDALGDLSGVPSRGCEQVEVESESAAEIARRARAESAAYAGRIRSSMVALADRARLEPTADFGSDLAELLDALAVLIGTSELVVGALGHGREALEQLAAALGPVLDEVADAQERLDRVHIADLLEFEVDPVIERFESWLGEPEPAARADA